MLAFVLLVWQFLRSVGTTVRDPTIRPLAIWLIVHLVGGTTFYRSVEGWGWLDSFYFCVITLATVGFGDLTPVTALGKIFTVMYVIIGIGLLLAVVNASVERAAARVGQRSRAKTDLAARISGTAPADDDGGTALG